jgi:hypothetical protein
MLEVGIDDGKVTINKVVQVVPRNGSSISPDLEHCLRTIIKSPVQLPPPPISKQAPPEYRARYEGKWPGLPSGIGTFAETISFSDQCKLRGKTTMPDSEM